MCHVLLSNGSLGLAPVTAATWHWPEKRVSKSLNFRGESPLSPTSPSTTQTPISMSVWSLFCRKGNSWCRTMPPRAPRAAIQWRPSANANHTEENTADTEDIVPAPSLIHQEGREAEPPLWLSRSTTYRGFTGSLQLDWTPPGMSDLLATRPKKASSCGCLPRKPAQRVKEMAQLLDAGEEGSLPTEGIQRDVRASPHWTGSRSDETVSSTWPIPSICGQKTYFSEIWFSHWCKKKIRRENLKKIFQPSNSESDNLPVVRPSDRYHGR